MRPSKVKVSTLTSCPNRHSSTRPPGTRGWPLEFVVLPAISAIRSTASCRVRHSATPMLADSSTGFTTQGRPNSARAASTSAASRTKRKPGTGTPRSAQRTRVFSLSLAIPAASGSIPGRPSRRAAAAVVGT